jgi:hypothetical protein
MKPSPVAAEDAEAAAWAAASTGAPLPAYWRSARARVSALLFVALMLAYALRVLLSVAIIGLAAEFGYGAAEQGLINSSFFIGYLWLQVPGGWAAGRLGGWPVLLAGVLAPSLLTLATPGAAGEKQRHLAKVGAHVVADVAFGHDRVVDLLLERGRPCKLGECRAGAGRSKNRCDKALEQVHARVLGRGRCFQGDMAQRTASTP